MNIDMLVNDILVKHHDLPLYVNTNIYNFILKVFKSYKGNQNDLNRIYNLIMTSNDNFGKIINETHKSTSIVNESCTSFMLSHNILSRLELLSDFQNCKYDILFFTVIDYLLKIYYITKIPEVLQSKDDEIQILWKILNAAFYYSRDYLKTLNLDCSSGLYKTKQEKIKNRKIFWNQVKQCFHKNEPSICVFVELPSVLAIIDLIFFFCFRTLAFVDNLAMPLVSLTLNVFIFLVGIILTLGSISIWYVYRKYF